MVPAFSLPHVLRFNAAIAQGRKAAFRRPELTLDDRRGAAVHRRHHRCQQGATLLHKNLWPTPCSRSVVPACTGTRAGE